MITVCKYLKNVNTKEGKGTGWEQRNGSWVVLRRQDGEVEEKRLWKAEKAQCPSRTVRCVLSSPAFVITVDPALLESSSALQVLRHCRFWGTASSHLLEMVQGALKPTATHNVSSPLKREPTS